MADSIYEGQTKEGEVRFERVEVGSAFYGDSLVLRDEVLRRPLGLVWTDGERADEACCVHIAGLAGNNKVVATLLLKPMDDGCVKMRQVAVLPAMQGAGIGSGLVAFAEVTARGLGYRRIFAHVRLSAVSFYRRAGYAMIGESFMEVTIPHVLAEKEL